MTKENLNTYQKIIRKESFQSLTNIVANVEKHLMDQKGEFDLFNGGGSTNIPLTG